MIGVCPQDDVLWDDLTSYEHMMLVAMFKGLKWGTGLRRAVDQVLTQVQLLDRKHDFASTYSGGMKRRLSVALSTVGDVKIVFFDEPTTGLDPLSRRRVWETINALKGEKNGGRVVVLTTHNMEVCCMLYDV
jgi:ABC-type multidrug transport system ATPase subunit